MSLYNNNKKQSGKVGANKNCHHTKGKNNN